MLKTDRLAGQSLESLDATPVNDRGWIAEQKWILLTLALLCIAGYATALSGDFMMDDFVVLFGGKGIEKKKFFEIFIAPQHLFYRPIGHVLLFFGHRTFGASPTGYHVMNLLLFYGSVVLAYACFLALSGKARVAAMGAALLAVHPFYGFLVNYVTASVIGTFFIAMEASFLCLLLYLKQREAAHFRMSLYLYVFALFSHEMALVMPMVAYSASLLLSQRNWRECIPIVSAYVWVGIAYSVFRALLFPLSNDFVSLWELVFTKNYIGSLGELLGWCLSKLFWPRNLLFLWSAHGDGRYAWLTILSLLMVAAIVVYLLFVRKWRGPVAFGLVLFLIGFLPILSASFTYVPQGKPMIEPHWFYFPFLGFFFLVASACEQVRLAFGRVVGGGLFAAIAATWLGFLWVSHVPWKSVEAYSHHWITLNDRDWTPFHALGKACLQRGDNEAALDALEAGLERITLDPPSVLLTDLDLAKSLNRNAYYDRRKRKGLTRYEADRWIVKIKGG